nr:MAG: hypothetical protein [Lake Baikal virophage 8]
MSDNNNTNQEQGKTEKQKFQELMVEIFLMIENLDIPEGDYLIFAEKFKQMNMNLDRMSQIKTLVINNSYYTRYVRPRTTTLRRKRLTEAQKAKHSNYMQCNCGRYIALDFEKEHLGTQVHYQGRRNIKYGGKNIPEEKVKTEIQREVLLQEFIIKHLVFVSNIQVDNSLDDEVV